MVWRCGARRCDRVQIAAGSLADHLTDLVQTIGHHITNECSVCVTNERWVCGWCSRRWWDITESHAVGYFAPFPPTRALGWLPQTCQEMGMLCSICGSETRMFEFDILTVTSCKGCQTYYHRRYVPAFWHS